MGRRKPSLSQVVPAAGSAAAATNANTTNSQKAASARPQLAKRSGSQTPLETSGTVSSLGLVPVSHGVCGAVRAVSNVAQSLWTLLRRGLLIDDDEEDVLIWEGSTFTPSKGRADQGEVALSPHLQDEGSEMMSTRLRSFGSASFKPTRTEISVSAATLAGLLPERHAQFARSRSMTDAAP